MLKIVENLTASPEELAGVPVEVSVEKPINFSVFTYFYLKRYSKFDIFFKIFEKVPFVLFIQCSRS